MVLGRCGIVRTMENQMEYRMEKNMGTEMEEVHRDV